MATVYMYSGGELVRTFERVDDNSVTRQSDSSVNFKFFDLGEEENVTSLDGSSLRQSVEKVLQSAEKVLTDMGGPSRRGAAEKLNIPMPRGVARPKVPGLRRATVSADWCVIYEPEGKP